MKIWILNSGGWPGEDYAVAAFRSFKKAQRYKFFWDEKNNDPESGSRIFELDVDPVHEYDQEPYATYFIWNKTGYLRPAPWWRRVSASLNSAVRGIVSPTEKGAR
jgi:hypothetical protein